MANLIFREPKKAGKRDTPEAFALDGMASLHALGWRTTSISTLISAATLHFSLGRHLIQGGYTHHRGWPAWTSRGGGSVHLEWVTDTNTVNKSFCFQRGRGRKVIQQIRGDGRQPRQRKSTAKLDSQSYGKYQRSSRRQSTLSGGGCSSCLPWQLLLSPSWQFTCRCSMCVCHFL